MLMLKQKQTVLGMIPPYHHIIYTIYKLQFGHCDVAMYHWPKFLEDPQTVVPCTCENRTFGTPKTSSFLKRTAGSPPRFLKIESTYFYINHVYPCLRLRNASASYLGLSRNDFYDPTAQAPVDGKPPSPAANSILRCQWVGPGVVSHTFCGSHT